MELGYSLIGGLEKQDNEKRFSIEVQPSFSWNFQKQDGNNELQKGFR
jgi:hypothetical protein